jgi:hypothetical protein
VSSSFSLHVFYRRYLAVGFAYTATHCLQVNMSLTIKSLNGDTSFLLTFDPPAAPLSSPGMFPGSFTILLDREFSLDSRYNSQKFMLNKTLSI